jgi:YfiH family protein
MVRAARCAVAWPADPVRVVRVSFDLPLTPFPFHGDGVTAVVSTRHGGVSKAPYDSLNLGDHVGDDPEAVAQNRDRLAAVLGVGRLTFADQRHASRVALVTRELAGRGHGGSADATAAFPATDAMITDLPGVALAVMVADCAPVVLYDPVRRAVGVAHSGRAGTLNGVVPKAVEAMTATFGSAPGDLLAGIGPAIGAASYEIGEAEAAQVTAALGPGAGHLLVGHRPGHALFDLAGAIRRQLDAAGVPSANVHDLAIDTRQNTDTFFSDRAARPCGRFAAVACLSGEPGTRSAGA